MWDYRRLGLDRFGSRCSCVDRDLSCTGPNPVVTRSVNKEMVVFQTIQSDVSCVRVRRAALEAQFV